MVNAITLVSKVDTISVLIKKMLTILFKNIKAGKDNTAKRI
ncbi:hypothetical protein [Thermodesulfovibrio sp. TK110]